MNKELTVFLTAFLFALPTLVQADDSVDFSKTPEGKILGQYVGQWNVVDADKKPLGEEKVEWILGGHWQRVTWSDFTVLSTYSDQDKCYVAYLFTKVGGPEKMLGKWDAGTKTMSWASPANKAFPSHTDRFNDDGTMTSKDITTDADGKVISQTVDYSARQK